MRKLLQYNNSYSSSGVVVKESTPHISVHVKVHIILVSSG